LVTFAPSSATPASAGVLPARQQGTGHHQSPSCDRGHPKESAIEILAARVVLDVQAPEEVMPNPGLVAGGDELAGAAVQVDPGGESVVEAQPPEIASAACFCNDAQPRWNA
jgi:hypothetical protein